MKKIKIGSSDTQITPSLLYGNKQCLLLYSEGSLSEIKWENIIPEGEDWNLILCDSNLDSKTLFQSSELCSTLRDRSVSLIVQLSKAVSLILSSYPGFLDFCGYLPLSSFMFTDCGDVLIMPRQIENIISHLMLDDDRERNSNVWNRCTVYEKARPAVWLSSLVYYSVTGHAPFEDNYAKESGKCIPLSVICNSDNEYLLFTDMTLSMKIKQQYRIKDGFEYFCTASEKFIADGECLLHPVSSGKLDTYTKKAMSSSYIHSFIRKKGSILLLIIISLTIVICFTARLISKKSEKPITYGMNRQQIVRFYYDAQNTLNAADICAPFAKGVKCPAELQITSLFVVKQTRFSYEGKDPQLNVEEWVKSGMDSIPEYSIVFGYTDLNISELTDGKVEATSRFFTSLHDDEDIISDSSKKMKIAEYKVNESFSFTEEKGYIQISGIETKMNLVSIHTVETYSNSQNTLIPSTIRRTESIF